MQNDVIKELGQNFIEYAVAVNTDRSIPDSKSGLKPVARRILYGAYDTGRTSNKAHVKSARIVGDVMGSLHPHGDSSIYGALVRLSQDWILRYPLIDFHGNNGNITGDGPADMRYTEARLSPLAEDGLLSGLKKHNVDFIPNYDETDEEPVTLPAIFPNLLCNPNEGIGVAMACKWAPHNLNEVAAAIEDYLQGKEPMLPGPDFPTGGMVINKNDIPSIMRTGKGSVKIRGLYKIEKNNIVFYEIPYGQTIEGLISEIGTACDEGKLEGIVDVHDETNKKGIRIVIECKKDSNLEAIANKLYSCTNLQSSFSYNMVGLVGKTPTELNLKDCIKIYVDHNIECIKREAKFDRDKALARLETVEGLLVALADIDNVIKIIKESESAAVAKSNLIARYEFTDNQATAILAMKLSSLARLEGVKLENEKADLEKKIKELDYLLANEAEQKKELSARLSNIVKKYGDSRRTKLEQIEIPKETKEIVEIIPQDCVVIMTKSGEVKRVPRASFKLQKRNGKGVKTVDDSVLGLISTNTIDNLMIFTKQGKCFKILVDKIPEGTNVSKGVYIGSLIKLEPGDSVIAINSLYHNTKAKYVFFFTKKGLIKKSKLTEYTEIKKAAGVQAIKIKEGDEIANVTFADKEDMMVITKNGMLIRFSTIEVSPLGRIAMGRKAITVADGDEVLLGIPIHKETDYLLLATEAGMAKKIPLTSFARQTIGGKGLICSRVKLVGAEMVDNEDSIVAIGRPNSINIEVSDIPECSSSSIGSKIINNSTLISIVKL